MVHKVQGQDWAHKGPRQPGTGLKAQEHRTARADFREMGTQILADGDQVQEGLRMGDVVVALFGKSKFDGHAYRAVGAMRMPELGTQGLGTRAPSPRQGDRDGQREQRGPPPIAMGDLSSGA